MRKLLILAMLFTIAGCSTQPQSAGAPVENGDADEDGVTDTWEDGSLTVDLPSGGQRTLDLKSMGGSSRHEDIYVWLSWMDGDSSHPKGHKPDPNALTRVVTAFAKAPGRSNADGTDGIRLHIIHAAKGIPHQKFLGTTKAKNQYDWSRFQAIRDAEFPQVLAGKFHFALIAHRLGGETDTTGWSRGIPGSEFVISLGDTTNRDRLDGTFMHELGHNLGLRHGGLKDTPERQPNYLSVMNYSFQLDGLWIDGNAPNFDYSRFLLPPLNETQLDRKVSLTTDATQARYGTSFYCSCSEDSTFVESIGKPIDWDCSGRDPGSSPHLVSHDIDRVCGQQTLTGAEDWSRIQLKSAGSVPLITAMQELTDTIAREILIPPVRRVRAGLENRAVRVSWQRIGLDMVYAYQIDRTRDDGLVTTSYSEENSLLDREVTENRGYTYVVSAILAERGGRAAFDEPDRLAFIRRIAPNRSQDWNPDLAITPPLPSAFLRTPPSAPATIRVILQ